MGVTIYNCPKCDECLHEDCFDQCEFCGDKIEDCDHCVDTKIHYVKYADLSTNAHDDYLEECNTLNNRETEATIILCYECAEKYNTSHCFDNPCHRCNEKCQTSCLIDLFDFQVCEDCFDTLRFYCKKEIKKHKAIKPKI